MQRKSTTGRGKGALSGSVIISFFINTEKGALKFSFHGFFYNNDSFCPWCHI